MFKCIYNYIIVHLGVDIIVESISILFLLEVKKSQKRKNNETSRT